MNTSLEGERAAGAGRVMIVDSDEGASSLLERYLAAHHWQVLRVSDRREAIRRWPDSPTSAVVVTSLDGHDAEVFELLESLATFPDRPAVVICTSVAAQGALADLGVTRVLPRPCRFSSIERTLQELLAKPAQLPALAGEAP